MRTQMQHAGDCARPNRRAPLNNHPQSAGTRYLPDRYLPLNDVTLTNVRVAGQLTYETATAIPTKGLFGTRWGVGRAVVDFNNNEGQFEATRVTLSHRVLARTGEAFEQETRLSGIPAEAHALVAAYRLNPVAYDANHPKVGNGRLTALEITADITYSTHELVSGIPSLVLPLRLRARHGFRDDKRMIDMYWRASTGHDAPRLQWTGDGARLTCARVGVDGTLSKSIVTKRFTSPETLPGWLFGPLEPYFTTGEKSY